MVPEGQRYGLNESGRWKDCFFCRWDAVIFFNALENEYDFFLFLFP